MKVWLGQTKNVAAAQAAFIKRARLNSLASLGKYTESMEKEAAAA
jgi:fructose-bisphosphate aldolase class I